MEQTEGPSHATLPSHYQMITAVQTTRYTHPLADYSYLALILSLFYIIGKYGRIR